MQATPKSGALFCETEKMGETTTYARSSAELGKVVLKRKAPESNHDVPAAASKSIGHLNGERKLWALISPRVKAGT